MSLFWPLLICLFGASVCLLAWKSNRLQTYIFSGSLVAYFASSLLLFLKVYTDGAFAEQAGGWIAPFGITYVADLLGSGMVLLTSFVGLITGLWSLFEVSEESKSRGFFSLFLFLLMGLTAAFLTGDLFHLYVSFEILLLSSFILLTLTSGPIDWKAVQNYVLLNLFGSTLFLIATGLLYKSSGTLNMAELALLLNTPDFLTPSLQVTLYFFVFAFAIKAGLFPLYAWLPITYSIPYGSVAALFGGLLTKVGVYTLLRLYSLHLNSIEVFWNLLFWVSLASMVFGVLSAASQFEVRKILSFHIVSQVGYITLALSLKSTWGLIACVFYLIHHIVVKSNLFLIASWMEKVTGAKSLKKMGSLASTQGALICILFFVPALSLAGLPIFSGFWSKLFVVQALLSKGEWLAVVVSLLVGFMTLFSMFKIWNEGFWKPSTHVNEFQQTPRSFYALLAAFAIFTVSVGVFAEPALKLAQTVALQLQDVDAYISIVLKSGGAL